MDSENALFDQILGAKVKLDYLTIWRNKSPHKTLANFP